MLSQLPTPPPAPIPTPGSLQKCNPSICFSLQPRERGAEERPSRLLPRCGRWAPGPGWWGGGPRALRLRGAWPPASLLRCPYAARS